ncbi:MAG: hypothetical protein ACLRFG_01535 [Clostridia bacterium]
MLIRIANALMSTILRLDDQFSQVEGSGGGGGTTTTTTTANPKDIANQKWFVELIDAIQKWVTPLLILACAAGAVWAIILGVKMAQADDKGKRDEAKANLVNVIIALVAVIALILIFTIVGNTIKSDGIGID